MTTFFERREATEKVIEEMLKEDCGTHFLDSGGLYGRNWQRNTLRDFKKEPEGTVTFRFYAGNGRVVNGRPVKDCLDINATISVYHFLVEKLDYEPELQAIFDEYAEREENKDTNWLELQHVFLEDVLINELGYECKGIYGRGEPIIINTYNEPSALSQVLQYQYWTMNDNEYVLLSIHGGCDVRGGYSKPRIFSVKEELGIFDCAHAHMDCNGEEPHSWYSDNAGNMWESCSSKWEDLAYYAPSLNVEDKGNERLYIDEENNGYCPICGAILNVFL